MCTSVIKKHLALCLLLIIGAIAFTIILADYSYAKDYQLCAVKPLGRPAPDETIDPDATIEPDFTPTQDNASSDSDSNSNSNNHVATEQHAHSDVHESAATSAGENFGYLLGQSTCCCSPILIIIEIILVVWVYIDSKNRGENTLLWCILAFFFPLIGIIAYLFVRQPGSMIKCPNCGKDRLQNLPQCPHCGLSDNMQGNYQANPNPNIPPGSNMQYNNANDVVHHNSSLMNESQMGVRPNMQYGSEVDFCRHCGNSKPAAQKQCPHCGAMN